MKKFISTSLAFLCIITSSASFPNRLSAIENKSNSGSNIKFYLKSASNILCTILPAFIANAIFKSRTESPISIIPKEKEEERLKKEEERKKQEEEEEKKSSTATNQTSITEQIKLHTDPQIPTISNKSKGSSSISLTESTVPTAPCNSSSDCHPKSQAALAQVIVAEKFKPLAKKATANIVELSESDLAQQNNAYCDFLIKKYYSSKKYAKYIKYVCLGNLIKKDVSKDNFYRTIYKYNGGYYKILGCYGVDSMNNFNIKLLNTNLLSYNESVYNTLETYFENSQIYELFVVSLLPYNNFKNTSL